MTSSKVNCNDIFFITLPSLVVKSFLHQLLDFALKSPRSTKQRRSWKPLTIITKRSILNVAAAPDPPLLRKAYFALQTHDLAQGFL